MTGQRTIPLDDPQPAGPDCLLPDPLSHAVETADEGEEELFPEFLYLEANPKSHCIQCGAEFPWSYYATKCEKCRVEYWQKVSERECQK